MGAPAPIDLEREQMSLGNFSKGPWKAVLHKRHKTSGEEVWIVENDCATVVGLWGGRVDHPQVVADAHLIAASPEMLELLESLLWGPADLRNVHDIIRTYELIRKAKGLAGPSHSSTPVDKQERS